MIVNIFIAIICLSFLGDYIRAVEQDSWEEGYKEGQDNQ